MRFAETSSHVKSENLPAKRKQKPKQNSKTQVQELREMLEELKIQMQAKQGGYVSLGVVDEGGAVLSTHSGPFEEALRKAGVSKAQVTAALVGFQLPPVLSVDWAAQKFVLYAVKEA